MDEDTTKIPFVLIIVITLMLLGFILMSVIITNILTAN